MSHAPNRSRGRFWSDRAGNRLAQGDSNAICGGNLGPQQIMSYTALNQLHFSMTPTASTGIFDYNWHLYDAGGTRIETVVRNGDTYVPGVIPNDSTGIRTFYIDDGSDVALTVVKSFSTWWVGQRYLPGGLDAQLAGRFTDAGGWPTQSLALVGDYQGSTVAAIKSDGTQETNARFWSRSPYGTLEAASGTGGSTNTGTGFTGASAPNASGGFVYLRNRWYDPQTGRFLTQDPIGLAGGVNLHAYAGNNPVTFSDPFGLDCKKNIEEGKKPCDMHTGNPILDNPKMRDQSEDAWDQGIATPDTGHGGLPSEVAIACNAKAICKTGTVGSAVTTGTAAADLGIWSDENGGTSYMHTHHNAGLNIPNFGPTDVGPSPRDITNARQGWIPAGSSYFIYENDRILEITTTGQKCYQRWTGGSGGCP